MFLSAEVTSRTSTQLLNVSEFDCFVEAEADSVRPLSTDLSARPLLLYFEPRWSPFESPVVSALRDVCPFFRARL